jgi:foldase protein PrsA
MSSGVSRVKADTPHLRSPRTLTVVVATIAAAVVLTGLIACGGAGQGGGAGAASSASPLDRVVARVDGRPITQADVDAVRGESRLAGRALGAAKALAEAVRRLLVRGEAARLGVAAPTAAEIASRLSEIGDRAGGEPALTAALAAAGMTRGQLTAATEYGLLEEHLLETKFPQLRASEAEVRRFYRQRRRTLFTRSSKVSLGDITVPSRPLAHRIGAEIAAGKAFSSAARHYSMDTTTRYDGGRLGWIALPTLPRAVRSAIAGLSDGGVTSPVWSFGRWHLYKVFGRRPALVTPFAEVARAIRTELTRRLRVTALSAWERRARDRAIIDVSPQ